MLSSFAHFSSKNTLHCKRLFVTYGAPRLIAHRFSCGICRLAWCRAWCFALCQLSSFCAFHFFLPASLVPHSGSKTGLEPKSPPYRRPVAKYAIPDAWQQGFRCSETAVLLSRRPAGKTFPYGLHASFSLCSDVTSYVAPPTATPDLAYTITRSTGLYNSRWTAFGGFMRSYFSMTFGRGYGTE